MWHLYKINNNILVKYIIYYTFFGLLFVMFFPLLAFFIPEWHTLLNTNGVLHSVIISVNKNKLLSKNVQSKLFWYYCFSQNDINTPKVYYYLKDKTLTKINEIEEYNKNEYFIIKPNYGTQGQSIIKIKINELSKMNNDTLLQEFVTDCFVKQARHFRINTININENIIVFSIDERKQNNNIKIASNHANGGIITFCKKNNCDFLSNIEQQYIKEISNKLLVLHNTQFKEIPIIGWDACLTCNGPYVFEGNIGCDIEDYNYDEYMKIMKLIYT